MNQGKYGCSNTESVESTHVLQGDKLQGTRLLLDFFNRSCMSTTTIMYCDRFNKKHPKLNLKIL